MPDMTTDGVFKGQSPLGEGVAYKTEANEVSEDLGAQGDSSPSHTTKSKGTILVLGSGPIRIG